MAERCIKSSIVSCSLWSGRLEVGIAASGEQCFVKSAPGAETLHGLIISETLAFALDSVSSSVAFSHDTLQHS